MIALAILLAVTTPGSCPSESNIPTALKSWATPSLSTGIVVGRPTRLTLAQGRAFKLTSSKVARPGKLGGAATFTISEEGSYEVALSEAAWIDIIGRGKALESTAHRHGPDCTSIRKIVAFRLTPGTYSLQLSGATVPAITVAIYRAGR